MALVLVILAEVGVDMTSVGKPWWSTSHST
jgi:hypothetical protein